MIDPKEIFGPLGYSNQMIKNEKKWHSNSSTSFDLDQFTRIFWYYGTGELIEKDGQWVWEMEFGSVEETEEPDYEFEEEVKNIMGDNEIIKNQNYAIWRVSRNTFVWREMRIKKRGRIKGFIHELRNLRMSQYRAYYWECVYE